MTKESRQVALLILRFIEERRNFIFFLLLRIISVLIPPLSVNFFTKSLHCIETNCGQTTLITQLAITISSLFVANTLREISLHNIQYLINKAECDVQSVLIAGFNSKTTKTRHVLIQSMRNFSEAARTTMESLLGPGIDGLVLLIYIPFLTFFVDFRIFIIQIAYICLFYFVDVYTTDKYKDRRDDLDKNIENYYAKLQDSNKIDEENTALVNGYQNIYTFTMWEWLSLQNINAFFYSSILVFLIISLQNKEKQISDVVLLTSYLASTQSFLVTLSQVRDKLTDTKVALRRLLKSRAYNSVGFEDLM